jgi:alpha-L-fucosidase 2
MAGRFEDGELAYQMLVSGGRPLALIEMLIHSHLGELSLLPALPPNWEAGSVKGLKARGGYELDIDWQGGRLTQSVVRARFAGTCRVRAASPVTVSTEGSRVTVLRPEKLVAEFTTKAGGVYLCRA